MKKTKIIALMMVAAMMVGSLTGCGSRTKATDITIDDGDTIIVDTEDLETETDVNIEENDDEDEILDTEVIGDDTDETVSDFAGAEDENIVLYAEMGDRNTDFYDLTYTTNPTVLTANTDIPVYCENGNEVGYIRNGATVTIEENANELACSRFVNPISGTEYDYLYIMNDYLIMTNQINVSNSDIVEMITNNMNNRAYELPTILNTPDSDMEVYEFRISSTYNNETDFKDDIYFYSYNNGFNVGSYMTYCIETMEDGNDIICKIYYKDLYEEWIETHEQ